MAGLQATKRSLEVLASNFDKPTRWAEDNLKIWMRNLNDISDADLLRGVEDWCRNENRLPNLARLRTKIEASPTRKAPISPAGCPACLGNGQREIGRWFEKGGKVRGETRSAACDCPAGQRLSLGAFVPFERALENWDRDPETVKTFHGTARQPWLSTEERLSPDELAEWKERAKKDQPKPTGSWSPVGRSRPR